MQSKIPNKKQASACLIASLIAFSVAVVPSEAAKKKEVPKATVLAQANELSTKAKAAQTKGNLDEAAKLYAKAFNLRYRSFGLKDRKTVDIATKLGEVYRLQKDYEKSEQFLLWAMKAIVRQNGFHSYRQLPVLAEYVNYYKETKKYKKAVEKQKIIVSMLEKKDDSDPKIYLEKVKLAEVLSMNAEYNAADYQLKDAKLLASDYEYKPSTESIELAEKVKGYISEKPFKKVIPVPTNIAKAKPAKKEPDNKNKVSLPKVNIAAKKTSTASKPKNASFASASYNITPTSLDKLDEKVVANGPLEKERTMLLEFIIKSQRYGIGVRNYVNAFDHLEAMVKADEPENVIKKRIDSLTNSLQDQFQRRYALSQRRPKKKKKRTGIGLIPNFKLKTIEAPTGNRIEDKYANTPLTEGYLKQIEREVVQAEMRRNPGVKYNYDSNGYMRNMARRAKRRRIIKHRNLELGKDYH